jgi:hypothetical protein
MISRPTARWIMVIICLAALLSSWVMASTHEQTTSQEPVLCRDKALRP